MGVAGTCAYVGSDGGMGTGIGTSDEPGEAGSRPPGLRARPGSYQLASVGGAGALLGDAHAEAGQAAIGVAGAQVEVVRPALAAGEAFHVGLQDGQKGRWGAWMGPLHGWQPLRTVFPAVSGGSRGAPAAPGRGPSSHRMLPDTSRPRAGGQGRAL